MSRPESPFLPPMTHMVNASPAITDWRQSYGKLIEFNDIERSQFKLIEPPSRKIADDCQLEVSGMTRSGKWVTTVSPDVEMFLFPPSPLEPQEMNDITELLTVNQAPYVPKGTEKPHANAINFLMRNWKELRGDLYPERVRNCFPPYRFSEVLIDSNTNRRADFIGVGPDGRIIVIEFGVGGKHEQVLGYKDSLENLFSGFNVSVTALVAYYSEGNTSKKIHIKPAYKDHMTSGNEAVRQFLSRAGLRKQYQSPPEWHPSSLQEWEADVQEFLTRLKEK